MDQIKRIKTHIPGFDKLISGGFPKGANILLSGEAGCGKTIFSLNYIYNGAKIDSDLAIYFTFEEKKKSLFEQAKLFGWDLEKLEKKRKIKIISLGVDDINKSIVDEIIEIIINSKAKRVVIDSLTSISLLSTGINNQGNFNECFARNFIYKFLTRFSDIEDLTTIFISQKDQTLSNKIAQYYCDSIIEIESENMGGDFSRNLFIKKMRRTKNDEDIHPMEISDSGIIIHNLN